MNSGTAQKASRNQTHTPKGQRNERLERERAKKKHGRWQLGFEKTGNEGNTFNISDGLGNQIRVSDGTINRLITGRHGITIPMNSRVVFYIPYTSLEVYEGYNSKDLWCILISLIEIRLPELITAIIENYLEKCARCL